jgi:hypothetical protein
MLRWPFSRKNPPLCGRKRPRISDRIRLDAAAPESDFGDNLHRLVGQTEGKRATVDSDCRPGLLLVGGVNAAENMAARQRGSNNGVDEQKFRRAAAGGYLGATEADDKKNRLH